jgi:choline-sulfatase
MRTLGALLQEAGYYTGYFGKWHLGGDAAGSAGWNERKPEQRDDDAVIAAVQFLKARARQPQPFALVASFLDPHNVYHIKPGTKSVSAPLPRSWEKETFASKPAVQKEFMTEDQGKVIWGHPRPHWEEYRDFYRGKVALYDSLLGRVLAALKESGHWNDTIVIATSDHGDMDTNHKLIFKGPFLYEHMVRIPLVVRVPRAFGGTAPRRETKLDVVNTDILPTALEFAGARVPDCDGMSLRPTLTGAAGQKTRPFVIGQYYSKQRWVNPMRMLRTTDFKYNKLVDGSEELYDLRNDPDELVNLAADAGRARVKKEYAAMLNHWIQEHRDPFFSQKPTTRDGKVKD